MILNREFQFQQRELGKIMVSWGLTPGWSSKDFDALSHKLLIHLGQQAGPEKLERVIYSELITCYGLSIDLAEAKQFASEVWEWWMDE